MPRYGVINERRNQLHEVIRLSGMNLIIDDNDHQLIIKVASIPSARVQIYFIDSDDYFARKATLRDADGKEFDDNDERAIFFARGVLETVRKLRWKPDVVHCHGWFSAIIPIYLRQIFADDPLFADAKIVYTIYDDDFKEPLSAQLAEKLVKEGADGEKLDVIATPSYENLIKLVIDNADGVVLESANVPASITDYIAAAKLPVLEYMEKDSTDYLDNYRRFYDEILK